VPSSLKEPISVIVFWQLKRCPLCCIFSSSRAPLCSCPVQLISVTRVSKWSWRASVLTQVHTYASHPCLFFGMTDDHIIPTFLRSYLWCTELSFGSRFRTPLSIRPRDVLNPLQIVLTKAWKRHMKPFTIYLQKSMVVPSEFLDEDHELERFFAEIWFL
jgi:hypothetical protein